MMKTVDILIVGAGISGLIAAERLLENSDKTVLLIDKSRSPGGRMATRQFEHGRFDHGAQFFTARSDSFKEMVQKWVENGWVFPWFSRKHPRYASVHGMNQLPKHLAHRHQVEYNLLAETVSLQDPNGDYIVRMRDLTNDSTRFIRAKSIIMTCPYHRSFRFFIEVNTEWSLNICRSLKVFPIRTVSPFFCLYERIFLRLKVIFMSRSRCNLLDRRQPSKRH